ncbi:ubl carboxyl-terminal hydrolase 18 [Girardinichthys multiradiatus]|uniref:ubl carboxyl-terminal hydrolase 18 n=1 Tax=Girardinichthys multiradiatus TaxID=208333 RepID=UPI001FAB9A34|nr:ubl carboxyl-terminal hydrolase 18 [Girardinichthys multiradiatus]
MSALFSGLYSTVLLHLGHRQLVMRGLRNYCLSCCVNTLLQTLSATWELAEILEKWEATGLGADVHNVPLQLKIVLKAMQKDLPQPAPHKDFLHCLDRNSIRLQTQHDADEVFLFILDLLQLQMNDRTLALEIQGLYKISLETQLQCLECSTIQTQNSHLLSLPLHIREEQNTLEDCMNSFFEQQELGGINRCLCAQCGTKTRSKQGVKVRSLPPILCLQLKRFRNMRGYTMKLNCRVTFPETFNFSEIKKDAFSAGFTQNDCRYTLYAVVVHSGSAVCGHYTAYVRHRVSKHWYYADDSHVSLSSWEEVQKTYEGRSSATAYMLMYRRYRKEDGQQQDLSG